MSDELQRLRDAVWNDGDPLRDADERCCAYCHETIDDLQGWTNHDKHLIDCVWALENDRRELTEIRVGDTVCDGEGNTRWVVLAIDGERAWIRNVNGMGHVTTSTPTLRKVA